MPRRCPFASISSLQVRGLWLAVSVLVGTVPLYAQDADPEPSPVDQAAPAPGRILRAPSADAGVRVEMFAPTACPGARPTFTATALGLDAHHRAIVETWCASRQEARQRAFDELVEQIDALGVEAEAATNVEGDDGVRRFRECWMKRDRVIDGFLRADIDSLREHLVAAGVEADTAATLTARVELAWRAEFAVDSFELPGARPDLLLMLYLRASRMSPLRAPAAGELRALVAESAERLWQLRVAAEVARVRAARDSLRITRTAPGATAEEFREAKRAVRRPVVAAEKRLATAQRDLLARAEAVLDERERDALRSDFLVAAHGAFGHNPYALDAYADAFLSTLPAEEREGMATRFALERQRQRELHDSFLDAFDAAVTGFVSLPSTDRDRSEKLLASETSWRAAASGSTDTLLRDLRASADRGGRITECDAVVERWRRDCTRSLHAQSADVRFRSLTRTATRKSETP
ncbi:MAG: hypothetical protein JNM94_11185 [Phycisphaerae bacterium]|nr:hypothetical protein [Phycisphaerae bacterium]